MDTILRGIQLPIPKYREIELSENLKTMKLLFCNDIFIFTTKNQKIFIVKFDKIELYF